MSDPILELLAAPPNPSMSVDEEAVHAGGRRRVRRRALRRTAVGVAGVAGAAAFAFAALGTGADRDALPAGPSPSIGAAGRVSAEVLDGRYAVEVVPGAPSGQPNVVFYAVEGGRRQQLAGSDASPDVVSMGTGSGAEGVMLGTAPADATAFLTVTRDGSSRGGITTDHQPLPGTRYQAVALDFDVATDVDGYVNTIWIDDAGEVRSANGSLLPSVPIAGGDRFFVARDAEVMGVFMADGSGGSTRPLSSGESTTMGYGQKPDGGDWTWRSLSLLPAGAKDVAFEWDAQTVLGLTTVTLGPSGEVLAWANASSPASGPGPRVTSVSWTDEGGTRHTDPVE
ncbi:hypothetical protein [Knoellia aerolata]|uniref:Uncharacterized protein n=1 Tax=Knoellia aerolata DSM 18566 TaxID=1385519 RepID=A0A0A0JSD1_9MICO|nr:hypothetical protein [Knoellia aerolata]KGN40078.1 hypothetical protein N801_16445 [Knoellia aerolata DSM 18566]